MIKKTIAYTDFDGNEQIEEFYFNLTKAELIEMELGKKTGFSDYLKKIVETDDREEIIKTFKLIIQKSVGKKSEDGKRFVKTESNTEEFMSSEAYSELFIELLSETEKAVEFIKGIIPSDLANDLTTD